MGDIKRPDFPIGIPSVATIAVDVEDPVMLTRMRLREDDVEMQKTQPRRVGIRIRDDFFVAAKERLLDCDEVFSRNEAKYSRCSRDA